VSARNFQRNFEPEMENKMSQLVNVAEMAKRLGVSKSTLYGLVRQRRIPHIKVGDRVLFDAEKVVAALEVPAEGARPSVVPTKGRHQAAQNE
jgi:excisionase family DNA binding protein